MLLWLSGTLVLFVAIVNLAMVYLLHQIAEKESIQELKSGLVAYERFYEQRRDLMLAKANSIARIPYLKATLTIPDVDHETLLVTASGIANLADVELLILADAAGSTMLVLGPDGDQTTRTRVPTLGAGSGPVDNNFAYLNYDNHIYEQTSVPVASGDVIVGYIGIGQSIDSPAALELARDVSGTGIAVLSDDLVKVRDYGQQNGDPTDMREFLAATLKSHFGEQAPGIVVIDDSDRGMRFALATVVLSGSAAQLVLYRPIDLVQSSAYFAWTLLAAGSVLAVVLGVWMSQTVAVRISRPIQQLTAAAQRYGRGDLDVRINLESNDEVGRLSAAFDQMATDIAESRRQLVDSRDTAQAASRAKSEFLARMSHEIRTPMNGIMGMTDMLGQSDLDASQSRFNDVIKNSSDALLRIVNDMLDFSKVDSGRTELQSERFRFRDAIEESVMLLIEQADAKGLELVFEHNNILNDLVCGDSNRIHQIVVNAILNAIKFTNTGRIVVAVDEIGHDDLYSEFRVSVTDTGIGIDNANLARVFELFYQVDGSSTREYGGTGLGLTICKQLVELMDGEIGIISALGKGSEFWFTLRLKRAVGAEEFVDDLQSTSQAELIDSLDCRVLLVEDNPVNQDVAQLMLTKLGCETKIAKDGIEAIECFTKERWDIVFMDCQMPRMNGYDATSKIRQWELEHEVDPTPIVALTANALEGDAERCIAAGMTDFISKPYKISQLSEAIRRTAVSGAPTSNTDDWTRRFYDEPEPVTLSMEPIEELLEIQATGDVDIVAEVIATFVSSAQVSIEEIGAAAEREDPHSMRAAAHRLKGASASVGGQKLASLCAALEQACSDKDMSSLIVDVKNAHNEFLKLVDELHALKTCCS